MTFLPYQLIRAETACIREPSRQLLVTGKVISERAPVACRLGARGGARCHSQLLYNSGGLMADLISMVHCHVSVDAAQVCE